MAEGSPDAWAVWEAWQGPPGQVAAIARQVSAHVESDDCVVELTVEGGQQRIAAEHVETDLSPRYRRSFKRMLISGSTPEGATPKLTIEAEFDNERLNSGGRGIVLRVWSDDIDAAVKARDAIAIAIDGGRPAVANQPVKGPPSERSVQDALTRAERTYRAGVAGIAALAVVSVVALASIAHTVVDPTSDIGKILFFCLCGADRKIVLGVYLAVVAVAAFVVAPRIFPQIEISDRSVWARVRAKLLGLVGATMTVGGVARVVAESLP